MLIKRKKNILSPMPGEDHGRRIILFPALVGLLAATFVGLFVLISLEEVRKNTEIRLNSAVKEAVIALDMQLGHLFKDVSIMASNHDNPRLVEQERQVLKQIGKWHDLVILILDQKGHILKSLGRANAVSPALLQSYIEKVETTGKPYLSEPFRVGERRHAMLVMPQLPAKGDGEWDGHYPKAEQTRPQPQANAETIQDDAEKFFVAVAFATEDLAIWLRGINLPEDSVTQLQRPTEDPWLRAWTGQDAHRAERRFVPDLTKMMVGIKQSGANSGYQITDSPIISYTAWRRLEELDLVLTVTMPEAMMLSHWWQHYIWQLIFAGMAAIFVTLASLFIAWTILLSHRRRQEAAQALEASEQRYRDLADSTSDWFWEIDQELKFCFVTETIEERIGIPASYLLGQRIDAFQDPDIDLAYRPDFALEKPFRDYPVKFESEDGGFVYIVLNGVARFEGMGAKKTFAGYRGTASDVTERRLAERAAKIARTRLVNAIESIQDGFALFNAKDELILYNSSYVDMLFPKRRHVAIGTLHDDLMREFMENQLLLKKGADQESWLQARIASHKEGADNFVARLRDGRWLMNSDQHTPDGHFVAVHRDITDLKAREHRLIELGQENERLVAAMQASSVSVVITDPTRIGSPITFVNDNFITQTGYTRDEVIGANIAIDKWPRNR